MGIDVLVLVTLFYRVFLIPFFFRTDTRTAIEMAGFGLLHILPIVVLTKSDSDVILCLQLLSKTLTCTLHLSMQGSIDHLCINPILWIGLIHK